MTDEKTEAEITKKARKAMSLRARTDFQAFIQEVRDAEIKVFAEESSTPEQIAEAHATIRTLGKISAKMTKAVNDEKHLKHRQQKRR